MACNLQQYSKKSDDELRFIMADAHEAAVCARSLDDAKGEEKYLDQINDACTIMYRRKQLQQKQKEH